MRSLNTSKEYGKEEQAIRELERIAKRGAVLIIGTPNSELLGDHGFSFSEIDSLMKKQFTQYCIFENALVPYGPGKESWINRLSGGQTGVIVSEAINLSETVLFEEEPEIKQGIPAGVYQLGDLKINTQLLHNTHSWRLLPSNSTVKKENSRYPRIQPGIPTIQFIKLHTAPLFYGESVVKQIRESLLVPRRLLPLWY